MSVSLPKSVSLPNTNGGLIKIETTEKNGEWRLTVGTATSPIISDANGSFDATKLTLARGYYSAISENKPQKNVIVSIIKIVTAIHTATTPDKANKLTGLNFSSGTAFSRAKTELSKQLKLLDQNQFYKLYDAAAAAADIDKFFTEQGFGANTPDTYRNDVQDGMEATKSVAVAVKSFIDKADAKQLNMTTELAKICGVAGANTNTLTLTYLAINKLQNAVNGQAVQPAVQQQGAGQPTVQAAVQPVQAEQPVQPAVQGAGQGGQPQPADLTARKQKNAANIITAAKADISSALAIAHAALETSLVQASNNVQAIVDLKTEVDDAATCGGPDTLPAQVGQAGQALRVIGPLYAAAAAAKNAFAQGGGDVNDTDALYVKWFTAYAEVAIVAAAAYDGVVDGGARKNTRRRSYGRGGRRKSHRRRRHY